MWIKALKVIPRISSEEWTRLDLVSRWLIASRSAVFVMTATAGAIGGLLAYRVNLFHWGLFLEAILGIIFAHATNNLLNDYIDYKKGVDHDNYYRAQYGPHPLEHGLLTRREFLAYVMVTGLIAVSFGLLLTWQVGPPTLWFFGAGLVFLLSYTWPLKYVGLGEPAVILVWGPLMIGGTYFVTTGGIWSSWVIVISLVYALGPTTVLLGKHTDKLIQDREKDIHTLPVLLGEKITRYLIISIWLLQYLLIIYLVLTRQLTPFLLIVFFSFPLFMKTIKIFASPRPLSPPAQYAPETWPLYLVSYAFVYSRQFGLLFIAGLILDIVILHLAWW